MALALERYMSTYGRFGLILDILAKQAISELYLDAS